MGPANEVDVVFLEELLYDGLSKGIGDASVILTPARLALLGVGPKQVAQEAVFGHFGWPRDLLKLSNCHQLRRETAVHAKNLVVDEGCDGHAVENILEFFPDADGVAALALVVEAVDAVDLTALVVAAQQEEVFLELDLVGEEQDNCLERILAAVNVVSQEEVVGLGWEPSVLKESQKVRELAMSVT